MLAYIFRKKGSRVYRGRYRLSGNPQVFEVTLGEEKRHVAEAILRKIQRQKQDEALGLCPPAALVDAAGKPIHAHFADYVADLTAKRRSALHLQHVTGRMRRLMAEAHWKTPAQITAQSFTDWRSKVTGLAPKTLNEYLGHASAFVTWLVRQGRLPLNPLLSVGKVETAGTERTRPTFSDEQMRKLIAVSGLRGLAYLLAVTTGLRRGELDALVWDDLHLDEAEPFLVARAATTKNRKLARLPVHAETAEALRKEKARVSATPERLVFPEGVPSMAAFRQDLKTAGIALEDTQGRRADFHSLRHTLATRLSRANVPPRIAMELMRHSDMRLTMKTYTDAGSLPMASELGKLPRLSHPLPRPLNPEKTSPDVSAPVLSLALFSDSQVTPSQDERSKSTGFVQTCPELASCAVEGLRTPPLGCLGRGRRIGRRGSETPPYNGPRQPGQRPGLQFSKTAGVTETRGLGLGTSSDLLASWLPN